MITWLIEGPRGRADGADAVPQDQARALSKLRSGHAVFQKTMLIIASGGVAYHFIYTKIISY